MKDITSMQDLVLSDAASKVPYLQTSAANALQKAINQQHQKMTVNSALRTLAQQLMLYKWYQRHLCGITAAAPPGQSNHNGGLAVDVQDASRWITSMKGNGWIKLGDFDPPHYDYKGPGAIDVRELSVKAFQNLWNLNNPQKRITVDGQYGPKTEEALLSSPTTGFAKNSCTLNATDILWV